jgi:hypothetical protein
MKAIVYTHYGSPDVLQLEEVAKPTPRDDEVLIKVYAVATNAADWHLLRGKPLLVRLVVGGLLKPKHHILGADVAGRVEAVGKDVTQFQPGDEVFGNLSESGWGGFAEYVCTREDALTLKPANVTFEEVAAVPTAALTALQALRDKGQIRSGQKVLIHGASGGVGMFAVQNGGPERKHLIVNPITTSPRVPHHFLTSLAYSSIREGSRIAGHYAGETTEDFTGITNALYVKGVSGMFGRILWTIIVVLVVLWLIGLLVHIAGGFVHLLLLVALLVLLFNLFAGRRARGARRW